MLCLCGPCFSMPPVSPSPIEGDGFFISNTVPIGFPQVWRGMTPHRKARGSEASRSRSATLAKFKGNPSPYVRNFDGAASTAPELSSRMGLVEGGIASVATAVSGDRQN